MIKRLFILVFILFPLISFSQNKITLREDGTILINGNPFFPVGIYNLRSPDGLSQDIINCYKAGFNTIYLKNPTSTAILDEAYAKGMYVWIESDAVNQSEYFEYINTFKNHPALLGWAIADDVQSPTSNCSISCLKYRQDMVKSFDPNHLTFSTGFRASAYYGDYSKYIGITDLNGLYAYPVGNGNLGLNQVDYDLSWERSFGKPIISIPQSFKWSFSTLVPTATQYRNMVYQTMINNPKAYLPYVWFDDENYLLNYKCLYYEVKAINNELKGTSLIPAIINGSYTRCETGVDPKTKGIKAAAWEYKGYVYVVAVNTANAVKSANIQLPSGIYQNSNPLYTRLPNSLVLNMNTLSGNMGKYEVQIYKILKINQNTGAKNQSIGNVNIYPNPSKEITNISFDVFQDSDIEIFVINNVGKIISRLNKRKYDLGNQKIELQTYALNDGMYFVKVVCNNNVFVKNLIIKK